jgi:hypothetical protein
VRAGHEARPEPTEVSRLGLHLTRGRAGAGEVAGARGQWLGGGPQVLEDGRGGGGAKDDVDDAPGGLRVSSFQMRRAQAVADVMTKLLGGQP